LVALASTPKLPSRNRICRLKNATPEKILELASDNIEALQPILEWNAARRIEVFRITQERQAATGLNSCNRCAHDYYAAERGAFSIMANQLKPGDRVQWNTPQGKTTGRVKKKLTSSKKLKGHLAKASQENPEYLVQSEKSDKEAAHKPGELRKARTRRK